VCGDPIRPYTVLHSGKPRSANQAPLLNSAKVALILPFSLISKTSMPLTFSLSLPVPLIEIQRQPILSQLLKISRVWRKSGGCDPDPAMKADLLGKVTDPSYNCHTRQSVKQSRYIQNRKREWWMKGQDPTGRPASWSIESLVSVKSFVKRAVAVALKFAALGFASR
jgi:hypothetical protein